MTMKNEMVLENKKTGEKATIINIAEKITIQNADGTTKDYAESTLKKLYKEVIIAKAEAAIELNNQGEHKIEESQEENTENETTELKEENKDENLESDSNENSNESTDNKENEPEIKPENEPEIKPENEPEIKPENEPENKSENEPENKSDNKQEDVPNNAASNKKPNPMLPIYNEILDRVEKSPEFKDITVKRHADYATIKSTKNFAEIILQRKNIKMNVRPAEYDSTLPMKKIPESYGWALSRQFTISSENDIEKVLSILKASYEYKTVK